MTNPDNPVGEAAPDPTGRSRWWRRAAMATATVFVVALPVGGYQLATAGQNDIAPAAGTVTVPKTVVMDGNRLATIKRQRPLVPDRGAAGGAAALRKAADADLTIGPWTVTHKTQAPIGGTVHDYYSQAPYWWPTQPKTADNPYGCPYVQKDGVHNPDVDLIPDHNERAVAFQAITDLDAGVVLHR